MSAPADSETVDAFAADLARRHSELSIARPSPCHGRHIKHRLDARLQSIHRRIETLPATAHVQFVGLDWLDENQHIIYEALEQISLNLPRAYARRLPAVETKAGRIQTRAMALAAAARDRGGLPMDLAWVSQFLEAYQHDEKLTLGELWALPTYFRAVVIERLCDVLDEGLGFAALEVDEAERAGISTIVSGCIISLRAIAAMDWRGFIERLSIIEHLLCDDPSGAYAEMVAATRNRYRERIEHLSRRLQKPEDVIAETVVALCRRATSGGRRRHVGYYLIDDGVEELKTSLLGEQTLGSRVRPHADRIKSWLYLAVVGSSTASLLMILAGILLAIETSVATIELLMLLTIVPALTICTDIVNWAVTQILPPRVLPKMDYSRGLPEDVLAVVAIPCLIGDRDDVEFLLDAMETNYLGNDDPRLRFVLLSDYRDATAEMLGSDDELLQELKHGVDALNARYGDAQVSPFVILHRCRLWNENAGLWMGWERKRGKIEEFNRWLLGDRDTTFSFEHGDVTSMRGARYVIVLDADNQLLPGGAAELVGTITHPLNRAVFDETNSRVNAGYTVIQPRVDLRPASANRTPYSRLMSGGVGIDLYHSAVSEAYQDLIGRGIYAGKGIYDVQAFARSVEGQIPANSVLSHDLLEGILGRVAFASDIVVLEGAAPSVVTDLKRQHRWIRGDWQLLPWLLPFAGRPARGVRLDLLGRWKLFDNLRRSLHAPSLVLLLFAGWLALPEFRLSWTLGVALVPGLRVLYWILGEFRRSTLRWGTLRSALIRVSGNFGRQIAAWLVRLVALPAAAWTASDAIVRTLVRLMFSHRRMLEWTPFADSGSEKTEPTLGAIYQRMPAAWASGIAAGAIALAFPPSLLPGVFAFGWLGAPALFWLLGREDRRLSRLDATDRAELRKLARCTWQFFERFVGPEHHWLPPDNYQETPRAALAERTSPTNIGLFLVSAVAAHDLGYLGANGLLTRIDGTTSTLLRMRRFRGHLYNWYRTRDLSILEPAYVSTVDSGNLIAALLICRTALLEIEATASPHRRARKALGDIVANIEEIVEVDRAARDATETAKVYQILEQMHQQLDGTPDTIAAWQETLKNLCDVRCAELDDAVLQLAERRGLGWSASKIEALRSWIIQLHNEAQALSNENTETLSCLDELAGLGIPLPDAGPASLAEFRRLIAAARRSKTKPIDKSSMLSRLARSFDDLFELRDRIVDRLERFIDETEFGFLFDRGQQLFHIGFNNATGELDTSYYDLFASEARIASLIAIAKGDVPVSHWVHLGRPLRRLRGMRVVMSWSATAFEYLMPRLFMETPAHTLLESSCRAVVREQRRFGRRRQAPWGVSESAFFDLDASGQYNYYAFGLDSLALRRTTRQRYVVSPYASVLALPFEPERVLENLDSLRKFGCWGRYGLYEALDFGEHQGGSSRPRVVQSFMAHHQAMIIAALANTLCGDSLVRRFHANPEVAAVEHLLFEALPKRAADRIIRRMPPVRPRVLPLMSSEQVRIDAARRKRFVNVLGNGHLTVRATACGGGDVTWNGIAITRWMPRSLGPGRGDETYLSDLDSGALHVLGNAAASEPEVWCSPHDIEMHQRFDTLLARTTIGVAPDNDVVFKRVTLTNEARASCRLMITHYAEFALASAAADQRHPAFNKLFIESEYVPENSALVIGRRRRSGAEAGICCAVTAVLPNDFGPELNFTCDRRAFLGRAGRYDRPAALAGAKPAFDAAVGPGLDPVAALGVTLTLPPGATAQVTFVTAVSSERHQTLELIGHFRSPERIHFSLDQARRVAATELTDLSLDSKDIAQLLGTYSDLVWPRPFTPYAAADVASVDSVINTLWSRGISGDFPICMAHVNRRADSGAVERLLALQAYLDRRGMPIDVVLLDESPASYTGSVRSRLDDMIEKYRRPRRRGRAFVVAANLLSRHDRAALTAAALIHINDDSDSDQQSARETGDDSFRELPDFVPARPAEPTRDALSSEPSLIYDNGYGGIDASTGDFVIRATEHSPTPAPWINVLANPNFGCIVSESGASTTWFGNSSEQRLTPWYNDPVADRSGEVLYLRDEETGEFWSPTPGPIPAGSAYRVRHGAGRTRFEHASHGLQQSIDCVVDSEDPVKYLCIRLKNTAARPRRLTMTYFAEWVLGNHFEDTSPYVIQELADDRRTILARNLLPRFGSKRRAFITSTVALHGFTTDRREFLGAARDPARPEALRRIGLSGRLVAGAEPCCAYQTHVDLAAEAEAEVYLALGAGDDRDAALALAHSVQSIEHVRTRIAATLEFWRDLVSRCTISTPNHALDTLFNHWLFYQNLAGRLWARTGLYQSAGGFGFRDQLQDSLALSYVRPNIPRTQILRGCAVQFADGDVLHWWHEMPTRGVRTRCSDDLLWLPFAVSEYVTATGDSELLDEIVPYLAGEPLAPQEDERYTEYSPSERSASVYEHCQQAIDARAATGANGLPLIGSGDWNDGLNRVGIEGRGESAWLGWFLCDVYTRFARICEDREDATRAAELMKRRAALLEALEKNAWDGGWYLRAFYDDGSPLGAAANNECRIDLNAQTWPAITGLARTERAEQALDAAAEMLVDEETRLIKLLTPPFNRTLRDPGYIKGYPPGVRENGGQYTHAATWAVWAAVKLDRPQMAMRWLDLLNPLKRVTDRAAADRYVGEPYVLPGDVYSVAPRVGQSGWTWYTGSAAWLYRMILEQVLGFQPQAGELKLHPAVPPDWAHFTVTHRVGSALYIIEVREPSRIRADAAVYELDGSTVETVTLVDDGEQHQVVVRPAGPGVTVSTTAT